MKYLFLERRNVVIFISIEGKLFCPAGVHIIAVLALMLNQHLDILKSVRF